MERRSESEKLHQFIASLPEADRLKYRDLIEEALRRDRMLADNAEKARQALKGCLEGMARLHGEVLGLQSTLIKLNSTLGQVGEASQVLTRVLSKGPSWN